MRESKRKVTDDPIVLRIISELERKGITAKTFLYDLGLRKNSFDSWKFESSKTYMQHIDKIADYFGTSIDYLVRGVEMTSDNLSANEKKIIERLRLIPKNRQDIVTNILDELWHSTEMERNICTQKNT